MQNFREANDLPQKFTYRVYCVEARPDVFAQRLGLLLYQKFEATFEYES